VAGSVGVVVFLVLLIGGAFRCAYGAT